MSDKEIALNRLISKRDVSALLDSFAINAALVRADGKLFIRVGAWDDEAQIEMLSIAEQSFKGSEQMIQRGNYRCYPLIAGGQRLGSLVTWSHHPPSPLEKILLVSLQTILTQALEKRDLTNETLERYREINLLYRLGETIGSTLDTQTIPQMILDQSNQVIASDVSMVIFWTSPDGNDFDIKASFGENINRLALLDISDSVLRNVFSARQPAIITDVPRDYILDDMPLFSSLLWAPFKSQDKTTGGILLARVEGSEVFTASDEKLLMALATQAASAVENARLHEDILEKDRLERELQLARNVQSSLIPRTIPKIPGWDFAAWWQPAREVSGDFYDFVERKQTKINALLDILGDKKQTATQAREQTQLGIIIADVSDKGMHAALFMAVTRSILRASTLSPRSPADNLTQANRLICADATGGMFVTIFYAQIDPLKSEITYVNCGHNPPFFYRATDDSFSELGRTGIMVGFDDSWQYEQQIVTVQSGDFVALYTDGITEAVNMNKEQFGEDRLVKILSDHRHKSAQEILKAIQDELNTFMKEAPQFDDITFVLARKL